MDVSQPFSSDSLLHAPDILFGLLSLIFQDWLVHGTMARTVLVCAFIPLLMAGKDQGSCDSYIAIAGSSLKQKLFECCILLVWGDQLNSESLLLAGPVGAAALPAAGHQASGRGA